MENKKNQSVLVLFVLVLKVFLYCPTVWCSPPFDIHNSSLIAFFHRQLKTFFILWPSLASLQHFRFSDFSCQRYCVLYEFIYLLTYLFVCRTVQPVEHSILGAR